MNHHPMTGSLLSINVAEMREVMRRGRPVRTGIWKFPVSGRVAVRGVNVAGDEQGDREVHGGPDKAVYAYAREDYVWWEQELGRELDPGTFGENLTVAGVDVTGAAIGERWQVGFATLEVCAPRIPCWKLGLRMDDPRFVKRFARALRPGAYLRIVEEAEIGAGDEVRVIHRPDHGVTVALVARAYLHDRGLAPGLLGAPELPADWRAWAQQAGARPPAA
jgi:MOSC domain-containing protein YiiM